MEAERRIGKTSILNKMEAEPPLGWDAVLLDLEQVHSAAEFAEKICEKVHERLTGWKKQGRRIQGLFESLGGLGAGPIKFPELKARPEGYWKTLLQDAIEDLVEQQAAVAKRVVFLFDEMPWMVSAIAKRDGEQTAMEVLDVLRALRNSTTTGPGFRMVLCGSVGLHHIVAELKRAGYRNEPVNDMKLIEVPPLPPDVATQLAAQLLAGEELSDDADAARRIAEVSGGFPYYIHSIVSQLRMEGRQATGPEIERVVQWLLTDDHDPCKLGHFLNRIFSYYPKHAKIALAILDHTALVAGPHSQAELLNVAKSSGTIDDDDTRQLLHQLAMDHYLSRDLNGRYVFRNALLRRWWLLERGLTP